VNWILLAGMLVAVAVVGFLTTSPNLAHMSLPLLGDDTVVSATPCDTDGDGEKEFIEIVMVDGRLYEWPEPYCGDGERYEGSFEIRVVDDHDSSSVASINTLVSRGSLFLWAQAFQVWADDYNSDGAVDFNLLSSDAGCNGCLYYLFTINPRGGVGVLSTQEFYAAPSRANSTRCIKGVNGQLAVTYYSQAAGAYVTDLYDWIERMWVLAHQDAPVNPTCFSRGQAAVLDPSSVLRPR
jgi:hypothetical protein